MVTLEPLELTRWGIDATRTYSAAVCNYTVTTQTRLFLQYDVDHF